MGRPFLEIIPVRSFIIEQFDKDGVGTLTGRYSTKRKDNIASISLYREATLKEKIKNRTEVKRVATDLALGQKMHDQDDWETAVIRMPDDLSVLISRKELKKQQQHRCRKQPVRS